jgi:3-phenylpropionate/trans-cinnamate dioxygenase ferredoxin subunit
MAFAPATALADLPDAAPVRVEVGGVPVCLVRTGETVRALHDVCSHQRWSLADGEVVDGAVECSLHGSTFDLDTGRPRTLPAVTPVPTYAVRVTDGRVEVDVAGPTNGAAVPAH